jgi:integrase
MNVSEALSAWTTYRIKLAALDLVAKSTVANQTNIATVLSMGLGDHRLEDLRKSHIEIWMGERLRTCQPVTVRGELNVLRQVLNWCLDEQLVAAKPRFPTLSVANIEAALPSDEAFLWVLANVPTNHAIALEFMMLTGLSPHELERVQVKDERQGGAAIGIGQRDDFPVKQPSRRRIVPLNGRARQLWFAAATGSMPLNNAPFPNVAAMQKAIQRATTPAAGKGMVPTMPIGAADITPKLMRKWFASKVSNDQPEHVLQKLMGHAPGSPITRRHYVRSNDEQGRDAVAGVSV